MASSSSTSRTWKYDVFPSFSGEDVRKSFLSHFLEKLQGKSIITFIDNRIERSRTIELELLLAIRQSRISIIVFSKNYASSTWCLNELVEIHDCHEESDQMVIPIFYEVDPSHVRKQTGEFGKAFETTCQGKPEDRIERWKKALAKVAGIAGYDSQNWSGEAEAIELISKDVLNKLLFTPSDDFRDFVGIGAHVEAIMDSMLCLESGGVRMGGILGPSGIGKSTISRALYSRISSQFDHRVFLSYKRTTQDRKVADFGMKLSWAKHFLSEILCQKDIKIESLGAVEQRLKHRKVLIVLDDVDEIELLETLVGQTGWFGFGSRIIVVTQDNALLKSHEIDLVYEVDFPPKELALKMFCQSAFGKNSPPDGFTWLAAEVVKLAGNLPLGLNVLGSSLKGKDKEHWEKMMPRLRKGLNGKIEKTLRVSYDGLDEKDDEDIFLYVACFFNGETISYINNFLEKVFGASFDNSLTTLADKSLVRIIGPHRIVQMHILLQKLGREIVRSESTNNPGKRRFLWDVKDISDVFENNTGTKNVLGIRLGISEIEEPLFINEKSFEGMRNLQFIIFFKEWWPQKTGKVRFYLPHQGLIYLPRKLRLLHWDEYPAKYIPSSFSAKYLVELRMEDSKLEMLWEGTDQPCRSLKVINLSGSQDLKEIPDLSNATNLEILNLSNCTSLATLPSSIRNLKKLRELCMAFCKNLEVLPTDVNLESLDFLNLNECSRLRSFPRISRNISKLYLDWTAMEEEDYFWIENLLRLNVLDGENCPLRCMPPNFYPEHLTVLKMRGSKLEKLWEGVQATSLRGLHLSGCKNLKEIPDLSKATNLAQLDLSGCKTLKAIPDLPKATKLLELDLENCTSLKKLPDSVRNLEKLMTLNMRGCTSLEVLPTNISLISLTTLDLSGCSRLRTFPQLSTSIEDLYLSNTAIERVPSWIGNIVGLTKLSMSGCTSLEDLPTNINLLSLTTLDLSGCSRLRTFPQLSTSIEDLYLSNTAIERVPSWIGNIVGLTKLSMSGCTSLEDLPTNINLVSLTTLDLSGCSRLRTFPQLSTSIQYLNLSYTAIERVLSWIGNIVGLTGLWMSGCTSLEDLPTNINLVSLTTLDLSGCSRLRTFPQLSTSIQYLNLSDTAIERVPSWIGNTVGLTKLSMSGCTSLEDLPTNINLVSLTTLDLSGCSRLRTFPQLSTSIEDLYLSHTAIEEVPSWIENIAELTRLWMRGCQRLRKISATIRNLILLQFVDFTECGSITSVSDASLVKTVAELHEEMCLFLSSSDTELLFHHRNSDTQFLFHNCFNLDQDAQKFILQSDFRCAILPGKKVPAYVTHRTRGSCLTVPLPQSSLSQNHLGFTACMIIDVNERPENIIVHWKFRDVTGMCYIDLSISSSPMDHRHLLVFHFSFCPSSSSSQLDCKLELELHSSRPCPNFPYKVIEWGVRAWNASSSLNGNDRSSETEYTHQSGESDVDTERSKKRMRMTVLKSQEPSNSLCGQNAVSHGSMALNLELSVGLGEAHPHMSSRSKVYSPLTSSRNFHGNGNGDGPSLNLSLSPFDPRL